MDGGSGKPSEDRESRSGDAVRRLLSEFAERTGLVGSAAPRRYLWTDAFAVSTWLGLSRRGDPDALDLALRLVEQVHAVLGRHRPDDRRTGWISGLSEEEGRAHPTRGGLRIGKPLNERATDEPFDEALEWDRDGQYFHYSTKWMHALAQVARASGQARHLEQAVELALATHSGFIYSIPGRGARLVWKASIDLSRPLVASTGQHDPLDGLLTLRALRADARRVGVAVAALDDPVDELHGLCAGADWTTTDPLGLGGLLTDALRLARLPPGSGSDDALLLASLRESSETGLAFYARAGELDRPAEERLAFRELGLSLGLRAVQRLLDLVRRDAVRPDLRSEAIRFEPLLYFVPLADTIELFWQRSGSRAAASWREHEDINGVTLAATLAPDGFLGT